MLLVEDEYENPSAKYKYTVWHLKKKVSCDLWKRRKEGMQEKVSLSKLEGIDYLQWEHNQYDDINMLYVEH